MDFLSQVSFNKTTSGCDFVIKALSSRILVTLSVGNVKRWMKWLTLLSGSHDMHVKEAHLCTIPPHERDLFRSISQKLGMQELSLFQASCIL